MITEEVKKAVEEISAIVPEDRLLRDEPMDMHTTFRTGGPAAAFVVTENEDELAAVLSALSKHEAEHLLVGNGSNLLVADGGYPGVIVKLG